jgi:acetylglutamate kinase
LARVQILAEALPYLQRFANKTIVVKYGGAAMKDPELKKRVVSDVVLLSCVGIRIVMIHGGGPEINKWLDKVGIESKFHNGLRVTDEDTMEIVEAVLAGKVNKTIVSLINKAGAKAVGLCGKDANILSARQTSDKALGFVGDVTGVDPSLISTIVEKGCIPVIASVASDEWGQSLNVNADIAAGEIAASLGAEKLILMTDVPGVMESKDDLASLYKELSIQSTRKLIENDVIQGGMIPKVQCCIRSIAQGVHAAHIIDGRQPHSLLQEILTDEGVGTMITES